MSLVLCFVMLPLTAFAVDIGMQRVTRRDAQAIADAAAQDAARSLGTGVATTQAQLQAIATATASSNASGLGGTPRATLYTGTLSSAFVSDQSLGCGSTHFNSYFTPTPTGSVPDAVLVVVRNDVSFNFVGGEGGVCRSAIARAFKSACMVMDSYAAALRSNDSTVLGPLTKILGTSIDANVLSSSGILTIDLDVLRFLNVLKTQLSLGTVDDVLNANVSAAQILQAQATTLSQQGAAATTVGALSSQVTSRLGPLATKPVNVGELLGITQGGASALGTTANAFDLAAAAVQLANGTNPVTASLSLPAGFASSGSSTVGVVVGSRPLRVCRGEGVKTMAQTSVTATVDLLSPGSVVGGLVTGLTGVVNGLLCTVGGVLGQDCYGLPTVSLGPLTAKVSLASASGQVLDLNCTGATPDSLSVRKAASLAPVSITIPLSINQTRTSGPIFNRQDETKSSVFTLTVTTDTVDKSVTASLDVPADYDKGKPGPSGDLSVPSLKLSTSLSTNGSFSDGTPMLGGSLSAVQAIVDLINASVLSPLTNALGPLVTALTNLLKSTVGLTIAGSTYTPLRTPGCGTPALAG